MVCTALFESYDHRWDSNADNEVTQPDCSRRESDALGSLRVAEDLWWKRPAKRGIRDAVRKDIDESHGHRRPPCSCVRNPVFGVCSYQGCHYNIWQRHAYSTKDCHRAPTDMIDDEEANDDSDQLTNVQSSGDVERRFVGLAD